jgi:hypothetical protein
MHRIGHADILIDRGKFLDRGKIRLKVQKKPFGCNTRRRGAYINLGGPNSNIYTFRYFAELAAAIRLRAS